MLRVGIDTRDLTIARTGARTYLEELLHAFPIARPDDNFIPLSPQKSIGYSKTKLGKIAEHLRFYWWKELILPSLAEQNRCDILFCTDYVVPLQSKAKRVPVFHDAAFWDRSQDYNRLWLMLLNSMAVPAAKSASAVITVSEYSKSRLVDRLGFQPKKIFPVYEAPKLIVSTPMSSLEIARVLKKYGLELTRSLILHVGVLEKRKNLLRLVKAFKLARQSLGNNIQLVLVGQHGPKKNMDEGSDIRNFIQDNELNGVVRLIGYVPDDDLPAFYQSAALYAFPSIYEGFGLPVLEAFCNQVPLIVSTSTSLPEIAGDAALFFDPLDIKEMAEAIIKGVQDNDLRARLKFKGLNRLHLFDWEKTAQQIMTIFETIV